MRLLMHDYGGYPFIVPLSRELALRGHQVLHVSAGYNNTPRGELQRREGDPAGLEFEALYTRQPLDKYSFLKRWQQEREYGRLLGGLIQSWQPQAVLSANTPLDAQSQALRAAQEVGAGFIFWLQDVLGGKGVDPLLARLPVKAGLAQFGIRHGRGQPLVGQRHGQAEAAMQLVGETAAAHSHPVFGAVHGQRQADQQQGRLPLLDEPGNRREARLVGFGRNGGQGIRPPEQGFADGNADALQAEIECQDGAAGGRPEGGRGMR